MDVQVTEAGGEEMPLCFLIFLQSAPQKTPVPPEETTGPRTALGILEVS